MKKESNDFIDLLAARTRPQTTFVDPFNPNHWFQGAYRTIQRRVTKGIFTQADKMACQNQIFDALPKLTANNYDASVKELIENLTKNFPITIGQSQKLVNIILKYYACLYYSGRDAAWALRNTWVVDIHPVQHVPIDSIVLFGLCRSDPAACATFVTASARFAFIKTAKRFGWNYIASIYDSPSPTGAGTSVPWSGIANYGVYFHLQTIIRNLAAKQGISPLLYEMRYLWAPA